MSWKKRMRKIIERNPEAIPVRRRVATAHRSRGFQPAVGLFSAALLLLALPLAAQEREQTPFDEQSAAYRTALHYDPSLTAPLEKLVDLYRGENRVAELKGLYESHIAQYPADAGAKAVLIRVYRELRDPQAEALIGQAARQHGEFAFIRFLQFEQLLTDSDPAALESLSNAIDLETRPERKLAWLDILLEEADAADDRAIAEKHLAALRDQSKDDLDALRALAEKMQRYGFHLLGLEAITLAEQLSPAPEIGVDLQILAAKMEAGLDRSEAAGQRLDELLAKVAPDYWRRGEIMSLRVHLLESNAARESMLKAVRARYEAEPTAGAALDLVELLEATGLRREAAKILTEASQQLPHVEALEQRALDLLERLNDDDATISFLEARLKEYPDRGDLRYRLAKTLFLAGDRDVAMAELGAVLDKLGGDEKIAQQLDLGRFLRRMNLASEAVPIFETVVEQAPDRLDVRRELAEAYLAVSKRESARQLVADVDVAKAEIENFFDFVQFLATQDFLTEARNALETRMAEDEKNLDLKLRLVDVLGRMGDQRTGQQLLTEARDLADTGARYRQWIEAGMKFNAEFDRADLFFDSEQTELLGSAETWTAEQIERFLSLCEAGELNRQRDRVALLLRSQLDAGNLPDGLRIQIRQLLVRTLSNDPAYSLEVESQLKSLLAEDPGNAEAYNLKLGLLYNFNQRPDLARQLLAAADLSRVADVAILKEAVPVFLKFDLATPAMTALRRLTSIESANRSHWEKLLNLLAATGDEAEFRVVARQLLEGIENLSLNDETVAQLRRHLGDSFWRSIARALDAEDFGTATNLLNSLDRNVGGEDRLWSLWARAFILNRLGQTEARDQAVQQLLSSAKEPMIQFPDGLAISLGAAERLLKEPPQPAPIEPTETTNLSDALAMRWGFETDPGSTIVQIQPAGERVVILDNRRSIYCVERETGKLVWRRTGTAPQLKSTPQSGTQIGGSGTTISVSGNNLTIQSSGNIVITGGTVNAQTIGQQLQAPPTIEHVHRPPRLALDPRGNRVVIVDGSSLRSIEVETGETVWTAPILEAVQSASSTATPDCAVLGDRVLCFDPDSNIAAAVNAETGKLIWKRRLTADSSGVKAALNSGASFGVERMMIFGDVSLILDSRTGETLWEFAGSRTAQFPLFLHSQAEESTAALLSGALSKSQTRFVDHLAERAESLNAFSLVAPAVQWATRQDGQPRFATLAGRKLLLMNDAGIEALSLDLPLAAGRVEVEGLFLGSAGTKAVFAAEKEVSIIDLSTGQRRSLATGGGEAFVAGHRVYAVSAAGLRCWNLNSGRRVFDQPWPAALAGYAVKHDGFQAPVEPKLFRQGVAINSAAAEICYPIRSAAEGEFLFVLVGQNSIAALGPREAVAAR
ncbi:MAG: thioredoxin-like negative regulator of GroEL [Verrucomicrobiales bacterium]|jgi:thioredoxin-like negative regulator of GroEL